MQYLKSILLLSLFSAFYLGLFSQEDNCAKSLQKAQKLYNQGLIEDIARILQPCIESGFTRNQRVEAFKLIILASLLDGNQEQAEKTMMDFLKKNPEYEIMPNDPVEFVYLFESYRTLSVFSVGIKVGPNITNPRIIEPYSAGDLSSSNSTNKSGAGYQFGLSLNRYIAKHVFINLEVNYYSNSYKFVDEYNEYVFAAEEPSSKITTFKESIKRYDIPLSFGYEFESDLFNYFLRTGVSYSSLSKAFNTPSIEIDSEVKNGAQANITDFRNKQMFFCHFGGGLKYKVPRGYLVADIRYHIGLQNIVVSNKRFKNYSPASDFHYIYDDFSLNSITFSIGYYFSFYKPKKN